MATGHWLVFSLVISPTAVISAVLHKVILAATAAVSNALPQTWLQITMGILCKTRYAFQERMPEPAIGCSEAHGFVWSSTRSRARAGRCLPEGSERCPQLGAEAESCPETAPGVIASARHSQPSPAVAQALWSSTLRTHAEFGPWKMSIFFHFWWKFWWFSVITLVRLSSSLLFRVEQHRSEGSTEELYFGCDSPQQPFKLLRSATVLLPCGVCVSNYGGLQGFAIKPV